MALNETPPLLVGEIVQLSPPDTKNPMFAGCLMVVTEPKPWGAQGFVQMTGENNKPGGQAFYRATWATMERTGGMAEWVLRPPPDTPSPTPSQESKHE